MIVAPWAKKALVLTCGAISLGFVGSVTLAGVLRDRAPALVANIAPMEAGAKARLADSLLKRKPTEPSPEAARLAAEALRIDGTSTLAARTLGLNRTLAQKAPEAERLMKYSQSLSRRDVPTQLWLLENEVSRDNIAGALTHYDLALRTSEASANLLFPILFKAAEDPAVERPLKAILDAKPIWVYRFVSSAMTDAPDPVVAERLSRGLQDMQSGTGRGLVSHLLGRLVAAGETHTAWASYARLRPAEARHIVRNGDFEGEDILPPFDWAFVSETDLGAQILARSDGQGRALYLISASGRGGLVARQLLNLAPGRYRLSVSAGNVEGDNLSRPQIELACQTGASAPLTTLVLPEVSAGERRVQQDFTVSSSCKAVSLSVITRARLDGSSTSPWIDSLRIAALGTRA